MNYGYQPACVTQSEAAVGYATVTTAPAKESSLGNAYNALESRAKHLAEIVARLNATAERILGPVPQAASDRKDSASSNSLAGRFSVLVSMYDSLVSDAQRVAERLESI